MIHSALDMGNLTKFIGYKLKILIFYKYNIYLYITNIVSNMVCLPSKKKNCSYLFYLCVSFHYNNDEV